MVNVVDTYVLATQGARASATMIFTMLNQIDSVPAREGLMVGLREGTHHYQY